jgi:hypothetical protein
MIRSDQPMPAPLQRRGQVHSARRPLAAMTRSKTTLYNQARLLHPQPIRLAANSVPLLLSR